MDRAIRRVDAAGNTHADRAGKSGLIGSIGDELADGGDDGFIVELGGRLAFAPNNRAVITEDDGFGFGAP